LPIRFVYFFDHFFFFFSFKVPGFSAISFHIIFGHHQLYRALRWGFLVIQVLYICWEWIWVGSGTVDRGKDVVKKRNISILIFMRNTSTPVVAARYDANFAYSFYFPYLQSLQAWCCTVSCYNQSSKGKKNGHESIIIRARPSTPDGLAPEYVFKKPRIGYLHYILLFTPLGVFYHGVRCEELGKSVGAP